MNPVRRGRHVVARPIQPADYPWVYEAATLTDSGSHWRLHGQVPPYEVFMTTVLFEQAALTYILERSDRPGERLGICQMTNHDATGRNAHLTAFLLPDCRGLGWPMEGYLLFVEYAFIAFNLNKLYLESLDDEVSSYESLLGTHLVKEAELRQHRLVAGAFKTAHIFALYRDRAQDLCQRFLGPDHGTW